MPDDRETNDPNPDGDTTESHSPPDRQSERIGPFRLLEKIGEGGMGIVYLAEQEIPVRRRVALKVIKQGMDTKQVVARFEAERQALALMDHPCVAKVFDAGSTPEGRPYFVMEYVKGVPISQYCDVHRLTNRERLELFRSLCEGVQHAHQKAIIHRDLKPSNILVAEVDGRPTPKIIDFGVAKATAQRLTEKTMFTELGVLIGTPEYMSPEQAELTGEDVDTRTDVYSLGVILYELLVGVLPFDSKDLRNGGFEGIRRMIREEDPKRPSTRFATLGEHSIESARRRRMDVPTILRQLRGDLDWITMKALEKDRARRYGSPMDLAADLARHLADEPVQARPPSTAYRARKFIRRHRFGVTAASVVSVALVAGIVGTAVGLVRARRSEALARVEQAKASRVAAFLSDMLDQVDPIGMGRSLRAHLVEEIAKQSSHGFSLEDVNTVDVARHVLDEEILDKAVKRVDTELKEEPSLAADLYHTIGSTYYQLQLYTQAAAVWKRAVSLSERAHGVEGELTLHLKADIGGAYRRAGRHREAEVFYREAFETSRRVLGEDAEPTLVFMQDLGDVIRYQGRDDEAESLLRQAMDKMKRTLGPDAHEILWTGNNLAGVLRSQGHFPEAEALLRDTTEKMKRVSGIEHQETLNALNNLAWVLNLSGRPVEAETLLNDILEKSRRVLGDEVYLTLMIRRRLADVYVAQARYDESEPLMRDNLQKMRRTLGDEHPETFLQAHALANLLVTRGRAGEAVPLFLEALSRGRNVLGEADLRTLAISNDLASAYQQMGRRPEAEKLYLATTRTLGEKHGKAQDAPYAEAAFHLACLSAARGDRSKAIDWLKASFAAGFSAIDRVTGSSELKPLRGAELDALIARGSRPNGV